MCLLVLKLCKEAFTLRSVICDITHSQNCLVESSRPLAQPLARPSALSKMLPWALSVSACWLYEVQWTAQIARGVENSFVTRTLLSAKARWSSTMAALSMWNCFFSQETHGFAPTFMAHTKKWPVSRWKQTQITLILSPAIFLSSLYLFFSLFPPLFGYREITVPTWRVLDMHRKFTSGIIHEVVGMAFMLMVQLVQISLRTPLFAWCGAAAADQTH